jgi:hypothetical protein
MFNFSFHVLKLRVSTLRALCNRVYFVLLLGVGAPTVPFRLTGAFDQLSKFFILDRQVSIKFVSLFTVESH